MTASPAPPQRAQVSYLPGSWLGFAADDVMLLAEMSASAPLAIACWDRITQGGGVDGVLGVIAQVGLRAVPNFALSGAGSDGDTRLVVTGKAQAEVVHRGQPEPTIISAAESTTWHEQRLAGRPAIRLFAEAGDVVEAAALPLLGGIVRASALAVGVSAARPTGATATYPVAYPAPTPPLATGQPTQPPPPEPPVSGDTMPPRSDFDSGLIDSLPWRTPETFLGEPSQSGPAAEPPTPEPAQGQWSDPGWPQTDWSQPDPAARSDPARSDPGQSDPARFDPARSGWDQSGDQHPWADPSGQAPWPQVEPHQQPWPQADQSWSPALAPSAPSPPAPPVGQPPQPGLPQPAPSPAPHGLAAPRPTGAPDDPAVPVVHAVFCPRRHLSPPYDPNCRVCDEPIAKQEPFAAPRPSLGVLALSTGDTVPLDRDVVLGRAPFHADDTPVSRPHLVQLASPGNDISRSHLRISLENWYVQVTDLGSTNGTVVTLPGHAPVRLRPHDPLTILPGTTVNIADEITVRFEVSS